MKTWNCEMCGKPEHRHTWLTTDEMKVEKAQRKECCNVRKGIRGNGRYYKYLLDETPPENPCSIEDMLEIST